MSNRKRSVSDALSSNFLTRERDESCDDVDGKHIDDDFNGTSTSSYETSNIRSSRSRASPCDFIEEN